MLNSIELLRRLEKAGVKLALNDQEQLISLSNKASITDEIAGLIREHKSALMALLKARNAFEKPIVSTGQRKGPLSSSQSGLWFIEQYEERSHLYNMPVFFRLRGELDVAALEFAFNCIFRRHGSMRTCFTRDQQGRGEQQILPYQPFSLQVEDLCGLSAMDREARVAERVNEEITQPFDLSSGNLTRIKLLRLGVQEHILLLTQHHIISDGWSIKNLFAELKSAFLAYQDQRPWVVAETELNYIDYAIWFNSATFRDYHEMYRPFWVEHLSGISQVHGLPLDKPRPAHQQSDGELIFSTIPQGVWEQFKQLCQRHSASPFIGLHALFALLLARLSGEKDIVVGTPLAYRERHDIEGLIGFFVNTLVLRTRFEGNPAFSDYLQQCREADLAAFDHQLFRFEELSEALGMDRNTALNPIFQIMLVYQAKVDFDDLIPGCSAVEETSPVLPAKTDISVKVTELMDSVRIDWLFASGLFEPETIERYATRFLRLLDAVVAAPHSPIWSLPWQEPEYLDSVIADSQILATTHPTMATVLDLWDQRVLQQGDAIALICQGDSYSFCQLDTEANRLAHLLLECRATVGGLIGLQAVRDKSFVVGLLAIWKAGAAYVPLDPDYPVARIKHLITDSGLSWILGGQPVGTLQGITAHYLDISSGACQQRLAQMAAEKPVMASSPDQLAQVIYTSGSTGKPKGVMIEQGALVNLLTDHGARMDIARGDKLFNCMSLSFDAGNMAALLPLTQGATLTFGEPGIQLLDQAEATGVSHLILPTALLASLPVRPLRHVRTIALGGEACPESIVRNWGEKVCLLNMYGPTECTVTALCTRLLPGKPITIGRPIANLAVLILDEHDQLAPPGVAGELCLAGIGVARGYWGRPDLTAERFMTYEHAMSGSSLRLYRTGDKARLLSSGEYAYLGRIDEQIKLRGYRIEPGEIEARIAVVAPQIQHVKVVLQGEGAVRQLVAYATARPGGQAVEPAAILHAAGESLPEYMLPKVLIMLPVLPLTPNGKLDLSRLPRQVIDNPGLSGPRNDLERDVQAIWQSVLKQPVGVEDDFFRLGGDSILSIQLTTRLRDAGWHCSVKDVFEAKSVRRLCHQLSRARQQQAVLSEQGILEGSFDLHPIQQWFYERELAVPSHWNQAVVVALPAGISDEMLNGWMTRLLEQHDALRLAVTPTSQSYLKHVPLPALAHLDARILGDDGLQDALSSLQKTLDPAHGRHLCWARIHGLTDEAEALFMACHHLVIDAVSWRILLDDFARLYQGGILPEKGSSYRQWGAALQAYSRQKVEQFTYWQQTLSGYRPEQHASWYDSSHQAAYSELTLDSALTARLIAQANHPYQTEVPELLVSSLCRAMSRLGLGSSHWLLLEGHGREAIAPDLDLTRTVGWFTSSYPVQVGDQPEWGDLICGTKEALRAVPDRGVGFNPLRYHHPQGSSLPLPDVVFNYLGVSHGQSGAWMPISLRPGDSVSPRNGSAELISIHGGVYDGVLTLRQVGAIRQNASDQLMQLLHEAIIEMLIACEQQMGYGVRLTPSDCQGVTLDQQTLDEMNRRLPLSAVLPLSSLQRGMLFHARLMPDDSAYHLQTPIYYEQALDPQAYRQAWQLQLERYSALRGAVGWADPQQPCQVIAREVTLPWHFEDLGSSADPDAHIAAYCRQELATPFDLQRPPLLRVACFRLSDQRWQVVFSAHHSVIDGWSAPLLMQSLHQSYMDLMAQRAPFLPEDRAYLEWSRYRLGREESDRHFWQNYLSGISQVNDLAPLFGCDLAPANTMLKPAVCRVALDEKQQSLLKERCQLLGVTPAIVAQYAWHCLVAKVTGAAQTLVGNVVPGRDVPVEGVSHSVGLYINTLPLCLDWQTSMTLAEHITSLQQGWMQINEHGTQDLMALPDVARRFQSLFVYENYPVTRSEVARTDVQLEPRFGTAIEKVATPLNLVVREQQGTLMLRFEYDAALIHEARAVDVLDRWYQELLSIVSLPLEEPAFIPSATNPVVGKMVGCEHETPLNSPWLSRVLPCWVALSTVDESLAVSMQGDGLEQWGIDSLRQLQLLQRIRERYPWIAPMLDLHMLRQLDTPVDLASWLEQQEQIAIADCPVEVML